MNIQRKCQRPRNKTNQIRCQSRQWKLPRREAKDKKDKDLRNKLDKLFQRAAKETRSSIATNLQRHQSW